MDEYVRARRIREHEGLSVCEIARQTGLHRDTIKKMLSEGAPKTQPKDQRRHHEAGSCTPGAATAGATPGATPVGLRPPCIPPGVLRPQTSSPIPGWTSPFRKRYPYPEVVHFSSVTRYIFAPPSAMFKMTFAAVHDSPEFVLPCEYAFEFPASTISRAGCASPQRASSVCSTSVTSWGQALVAQRATGRAWRSAMVMVFVPLPSSILTKACGGNAFALKAALGHSQISTTDRYVHSTIPTVVIDMSFPGPGPSDSHPAGISLVEPQPQSAM